MVPDGFDSPSPDLARLRESLPAGIHFPSFVQQSLRILDSYRFWLKQDLVIRDGSAAEQAVRLFFAEPAVLSSGSEPDPLLNYGNARTLALWDMAWENILGLPGRLTAEPMEQTARDVFLKRVRENGFITDYEGIRISRTGRRFWIRAATVWNILAADGTFLGQAATFSQWQNL